MSRGLNEVIPPESSMEEKPTPEGSGETSFATKRIQHPSGVRLPVAADRGYRSLRSLNPRLLSVNPPGGAVDSRGTGAHLLQPEGGGGKQSRVISHLAR